MKPIKTLLAATIILTLPATPALATTIPPANIGIHKTVNEPAPPDTGGGNNSGKGSSNQGSESAGGSYGGVVSNTEYKENSNDNPKYLDNAKEKAHEDIKKGKNNSKKVFKNNKNKVEDGEDDSESIRNIFGKVLNLNNTCVLSSTFSRANDATPVMMTDPNQSHVFPQSRKKVEAKVMVYEKTQSGFDNTFVNKCPNKETEATDKWGGRLQSIPYMAAYAKKNAQKGTRDGTFKPVSKTPGSVSCQMISGVKDLTPASGYVDTSVRGLYNVKYFTKKIFYRWGFAPSCSDIKTNTQYLGGTGLGTMKIKITAPTGKTFGSVKPTYDWTDTEGNSIETIKSKIEAAKCKQSGGKIGINSSLTASGFLPFNEKVKADRVGTDGGGFVADNYSPYTGGIEKGCAYWVKRTRVKLNNMIAAWAKCVVSYKYEGETLAGDYWDGYGDEQGKIHNTPYGEAIKKDKIVDLSICAETFDAKFPEKGNLFPTGKLGRYGAKFTWKIDDPEVEIKNCEPDGKGGCKDWSAKIVKHNITEYSPYYMYRQGCDFKNDSGDSMTWVRRFKTLTDGEKKNPEFDKYKGKLLSYNIDDCMDDTGNGVNKYSCTNNTSGKQPTLADDESDKTSVGKKDEVPLYSDKNTLNSPYIYDRKKPKNGVDGREDVYKNGGMRLYRNNKPQWVKFPKPSIGYDNKKTSAPSNARLTEQYLLIRNGGTPFVSTPEANSVWSYNNDKGMFIPKPGTVKRTGVDNPFINKTTSKDGSRLRVNKYFNDGTVDGYDAAKSLNIKISEPNSGTVQTQIITPMRKKLDGTKYSKFDNDYIIPLKNNRGENAYFDMKYGVSLDWWSEQGKPLQVAPAAKIRAKFPITFLTFNKGVNPNHNDVIRAWAQNVSDIEKEMMCIGPYTNIAGIRGTQ